MSKTSHHIHLGGPLHIRTAECCVLDAKRILTVDLPPKGGLTYRFLTVYKTPKTYLVLKRGGMQYLGEESFAYFLRAGEDPVRALEPKRWKGRGRPPRSEWPELDPRMERDLDGHQFT